MPFVVYMADNEARRRGLRLGGTRGGEAQALTTFR